MNAHMPMDSRRLLTNRFEQFVQECLAHDSPLYARLSAGVAQDFELLDLAAQATREPVPNLFFAAVHSLLLQGEQHRLADYYPSLRAHPRKDDGLLSAFADFCREHRSVLEQLISSRLVQTNEINRSACLLPAFEIVFQLGGCQPLALIEVGTSAGLNLIGDRYRYHYSNGQVVGLPASPVTVHCDLRGHLTPPLPSAYPLIGARTGIDLHPIDLGSPQERLWLQALIWPDHLRRADQLQAAIALLLDDPPTLMGGDALDLLPGVLNVIHHEQTLCLFHSATLNQFHDRARAALDEQLQRASMARPLFRVSLENYQLSLREYRRGELVQDVFLADVDGHGRWMQWRQSK